MIDSNNRGIYLLTIVLSTLQLCMNLVFSWLLGTFIDLIALNSFNNLYRLGSFVIGIVLVDLLIAVVRNLSEGYYIKKSLEEYKRKVFQRIVGLPLQQFQSTATSSFLSGLSNDIVVIKDQYLIPIVDVVPCFLSAMIALAMLLYYSITLTFIALISSMIPVIFTALMSNTMVKKEKELSDHNDLYISRLKDLLNGFVTLKSYRKENKGVELFHEMNQSLENSRNQRYRLFSNVNSVTSDLMVSTQFVILFCGSLLAIKGRISAGTVIIFVNLINSIVRPLQMIPSDIANIKAAKGILQKMELSTAIEKKTPEKDLNTYIEHIIVNDLSCGYDDQMVLKHISCCFEKGKKYAIVGPSGSGKTTLIKALMGYFKDYSGSILYEGEELKTLSLSSLYEQISFIDQNVFIFDESMQDNITMFQNVDEQLYQSILQKTKLSGINESKCGENGNRLSGGQKQRISIARALYSLHHILLIDEATSSLDHETAHAITRTILDLKDTTSIIITHHLEKDELVLFDEILFMKDGMIKETGSFDELMNQKGLFHGLYTLENK